MSEISYIIDNINNLSLQDKYDFCKVLIFMILR